MKKIIKVFEIIIFIFATLILICNISFMFNSILHPTEVPSYFGKKVYIVKSGSVQTDINKRELVLVEKDEKIKVGDVVAVKSGNKKATTYSVKSIRDNVLNLEDDSKDGIRVTKNSIEGKVKYQSKFWGETVLLMRNPLVICLNIIILLIICACIIKFNI